MSFGELGEIQKIHDAVSGSTKKSGDANSSFENETDLQYFRDKLTDENITKAIEWLNKQENRGVSRNAEMLQRLESMRGTLRTIQTQVRSGQAKLLEATAGNMDITYDDKFGDLHKTSRTYPGNYEFPNGGAFVQENVDKRNVAVVWNKDQKTIHSIILNDVQYINTNGVFKSNDGSKTITVAHDPSNKKIEIRTPSLTTGAIERLSPIENLVTKLQKSIDSYAVTKGYESGAKLEPKDKYSLTGEYQIILHRKIRAEDTSTFGKPLVLDGIYLKDGNGKLKGEDMLVREIVGKIEEAVKPADVVPQANVTASPPATPAPQAPAAAPTAAPTPRTSVSGERETRALQYNRDFLEGKGKALKELANTVPKVLPDDVLTTLKTYIMEPTSTNANKLQQLLKDNYGKDTGARGSVGPLTLAAINALKFPPTGPQNGTESLRQAVETVNDTIMKKIGEYIDKRIQAKDVAPDLTSPFSQIIFAHTGNSLYGDLQMSDGGIRKFEDVLQGIELNAWRKLPTGEKNKVIDAANALWNRKNQAAQLDLRQSRGRVVANETRDITTLRNGIIGEAKTRFIDVILSNDELFRKEFVALSREAKKTPVKDPFGEITIPTTNGYFRGDLQMKDNNPIPTAYEKVLTGEKLTNWRTLSLEERAKIITELNKDWNTRAQKKLDNQRK